MNTYLECWAEVAATLFSQALAGEPDLVETQPDPLEAGSFGFAATLVGHEGGRFTVWIDSAVLDAPLAGEGVDQKAGWAELLKEIADAAAGELLVQTGKACRVEKFEEAEGEGAVTKAFQLKTGEHAWTVLVSDETQATEPAPRPETEAPAVTQTKPVPEPAAINSGIDLLLDVELEASLRFGSRELPLGEILDLGPGDVVQLDRHVEDAVDLIVGDKIVARGEVVLVNGNFGLRVTEVAAPRRRLESVRCLF